MAATVGLTDHCFTTVQHTGTPAGQRIEILVGGVPVPTYLAEPAGDAPRRIILFFSDVFGAFYLNNQLVQDYLATQGESRILFQSPASTCASSPAMQRHPTQWCCGCRRLHRYYLCGTEV